MNCITLNWRNPTE